MANILWVSANASSNGDGSAGAPFSSIQDAIDAAAPGTVIKVMAGSYEENIRFHSQDGGTADAPIILESVDGAGNTIIKPAVASIDTVNIDGADNIVIRGFDIYGSSDASRQAVQIHIASGDNPASNIVMDGNIIHRGAGDGIKVSKSDHITLTNNQILGGGDKESAIDFVGVSHAEISGNSILDSGNIGMMIKGGSDDIRIVDNVIDGTGSSGIEIGGYTELKFYYPGFLDSGNTFEARNVLVSGNQISNVGGTAVRLIGAQDVTITENEISDANRLIRLDDSSKYHETWHTSGVDIYGNSFDEDRWLIDRSHGDDITIGDNYTDGRDLPEPVAQPEPTPETEATPPSAPDAPPAPEEPLDPQPVVFNQIDGSSKSETIDGTSGQDWIDAGNGQNKVFAGGGDDVIISGGNDDRLYGEAGDDVLNGGGGKDRLYGGEGADTMTGGDGEDRFYFENRFEVGLGAGHRDVITDFQSGEDTLRLSNFDAKLRFLDQEGAAFTGREGEVTWKLFDNAGTAQDYTLISGDLNGDGVADFEIELTGLVMLTDDDIKF